MRKGITGLETAIILIAFVIVASVFSFAVLNMGLLTTQKASSTVESGMKQASSAIQLSGSVIAYDNNTKGIDNATGKVERIDIYIKLAPGHEPIDTSDGNLVISFTNSRVHVADTRAIKNSNVSGDLVNATTLEWVTGDGDDLLEFGETLLIKIDLSAIEYDGEHSGALLGPNEWFKVEIKPPVGAILSVERTIPAAIETVMDLG